MKTEKSLFGKKLAAALVSVFGVADVAMAQVDAAPRAIEEIVVTAQKRAENMQDVPIAISAFSANELQTSGILNTENLENMVPGLSMRRQLGSASVFLRGVGTNATGSGNEAPVATYIDGVYQSDMLNAISAFNNVERIEVLKGPQGTLFGRNTTGGVIHIITKDPTHEKQLDVGISAGNYETYGGNLYGSAGLTENVAMDVAISLQRQNEGYGTNLFNGRDFGLDEYTMFRSKLLYTPSDLTSVKLAASWGQTENDGLGRYCSAPLGCTLGVDKILPDVHDVNLNYQPENRNKGWEFLARVEHSFSDLDFVSQTSWHDSTGVQKFEQFGSSIPRINGDLNITTETFSQEFQIQSNQSDKSYRWIAGVFFWQNKSMRDPMWLRGPLIPSPGGVVSFSTLETESVAMFGQGTYDFTDQTSLTIGLRWTQDQRDIYGHTQLAPGFVRQFDTGKKFNEPTWRVALEHNLTDDTMVYASYNRGFKSGNFNNVVSTGIVAPPVEPEILDAYEVGMKSDFLDSRLRLNVAAFFYQYDELQLTKVITGGTQLLNAAEAEIFGFEADGQAIITDNLSLRFGLSALDTEYIKFENCPVTTPVPGANVSGSGDCTGNDLIRSPDYSFNLGGLYEIPTQAGMFALSLNAAYSDGFYWEPDSRLYEDAATIVNTELSWRSPNEKYRLRFYCNNVTDEEYSLYTQASGLGDLSAPAPPRLFGVSLNMSMY